MAFEKILVLDDELIIRKSLQEILRRKRYSVAAAATIKTAEKYLQQEQFDLIFMDLRLPDGDGTSLLNKVSKKPDAPLVIMMTGYATVESAVDCIRAGAFEYLIKPFSTNQIDMVIKKAEDYTHLLNVNRFYSQSEAQETKIVGKSPAIRQLRKMVGKVAPTRATVLIHGESGTGKEVIAGEIHKASDRSGAPFIKVNCAAISETLIESEFFGHEKGAFTGAVERRRGRFELANGGTILLDEISEISPGLQAKLLRVLQEQEFERVGGNKTIQVDVRVLATTNRDLAKCVKRGEFREDLYYRLNVFPIHNPPLRDKKEDILLLADHFFDLLQRKHGVKIQGYSMAAKSCLLAHDWPGNIRELQNTVERAIILTDSGENIEPSALGLLHLADQDPPAPDPVPQDSTLDTGGSILNHHFNEIPTPDALIPIEELERRYILHALEVTKGNRSLAARLLKVSSRTLRNKLKVYEKAEQL